jgi:hypothetical protein
MALNVHTVLLLIGAILILISSVSSPSAVNLFNLGWGFVVLAFVFG